MSGIADSQASLEAVLKDEIIRMYQEVADQPEGTFHFYHGRRPEPWRPLQGSEIPTSAASSNRGRPCSISAVGQGWMPSSRPGRSVPAAA